ncbi:hypothetical protein SAMN05443549_103318 [Flavobacterium fluvii]|uniref:Uncharacterized protein n=1 Tax=Flavobacterium fluvii TaxID=468056 RepID=A0A1M5J0G9_9FLAO|nr:hypothetical protein SAMN05443549_103318 [Flavobacterium fluvii]
MYRELNYYRLLDTIFNIKAVALMLKITRRDELICFTISIYIIPISERKTVCDSVLIPDEKF